MEKFLKINVKSGWRIHGSLGQYDPESCKIGLRWKKLATICRNYEIFLLKVPFVKLKTIVKTRQNYETFLSMKTLTQI